MIHELRIYHCMPGKLAALNQRFADVALRLWDKHGIRPIGFWRVVVGSSNHDFYYLLEWPSLAERECRWHAFNTDTEWLAAKAESERDGPLISHASNLFLEPTAYSPRI